MSISVEIGERDFSQAAIQPDLELDVRSYSWNVIGGPEKSEIVAHGDEPALWDLINRLRCPLTLMSDALALPVWWGFIDRVELEFPAAEGNDLGIRVTVSLEDGGAGDEWANVVDVIYGSSGGQSKTSATFDADSIYTYGIKSLHISLDGASLEQANARRDTYLNINKWPIPTIEWTSGVSEPVATIYGAGWWKTLAWRYYTNTGNNSVATTAQIVAIVTASGPFFVETEIINASGISSSENRDGNTRAQKLIEDMLKSGTNNNRRMLATADINRRILVYEEPVYVPSIAFQIGRDGNLRDLTGSPIWNELCTAGVWAELSDVIDSSANLTKIANPSPVFIDRAIYDAERDLISYLPRGTTSPWDLFGWLIPPSAGADAGAGENKTENKKKKKVKKKVVKKK